MMRNPVRSYFERFDRADEADPPDDQRLLLTMMLVGIGVIVLTALAIDPTMGWVWQTASAAGALQYAGLILIFARRVWRVRRRRQGSGVFLSIAAHDRGGLSGPRIKNGPKSTSRIDHLWQGCAQVFRAMWFVGLIMVVEHKKPFAVVIGAVIVLGNVALRISSRHGR